jgi:glycosyltransferase involved in cell wall biosynthesis
MLNIRDIKFSIIIPVYNGAGTISDAVSSVINQTFNKDHYEVVIVDDSSTDGSSIICKKIIEKNADKNISLHSTDYNSGPGIARNIGIENAKGEF